MTEYPALFGATKVDKKDGAQMQRLRATRDIGCQKYGTDFPSGHNRQVDKQDLSSA